MTVIPPFPTDGIRFPGHQWRFGPNLEASWRDDTIQEIVRGIMDARRSMVEREIRKEVIAILREQGYTVIEPEGGGE